jgi:hypothetical protein
MAERSTDADGALGEYAALRQEIDTRANRQHNIVTTQLVTAGALFGFALSDIANADATRSLVILLVPITSYVLFGRYADNVLKIRRIHQYLRDNLAPRVPGLQWERWADDNQGGLMVAVWIAPIGLTFLGAPAAALLLWSVAAPPTDDLPASIVRFLVAIDLASVVASIWLVLVLIRAFRGRWWPWRLSWLLRGGRSDTP